MLSRHDKLTQINAREPRPAPIAKINWRVRPMTSVSGKIDPVVRRITAADIAEALGRACAISRPRRLRVGLCALYAGGGIVILLSLTAFA